MITDLQSSFAISARRSPHRAGLYFLALMCICWCSTSFAASPTSRPYSIHTDIESAVYTLHQPITWTIEWTADTSPPSATYSVLAGQVKPVAEGGIVWEGKHASVHAQADMQGTLLLKVSFDGSKDPGLGGAVVAPESIKPAAPKPDDFDAFWDAKLKELAEVDPDPQLTAGESHKENVDYWKISLNNIRGIKIKGQVARPRSGDKFPAVLIVQWAGVYGLDQHWVTDRAADGYLALNISAHDIPIDETADYYKQQFAGPLKDYWAIGNDDRNKSYFLHMYLSCYRAVEYLAQRPDWDGKTLVVMGGSQGGQQSLLTAALHPDNITAALADVPAGCDMLGPTVDRKGGWPQWYDITWGGRDAAKVREASRYYDIVNFAPRIKCPVVVGAGLLDQTCPAAGICAAVNQISSPHELLLFPFGEHQDENNSHGRWNKAVWQVWLPSLVKGVVPKMND